MEPVKPVKPVGDAEDIAARAEAYRRELRVHCYRMTRTSPVTPQIAATAAFLAPEGAAAITGTRINATAGTFPG